MFPSLSLNQLRTVQDIGDRIFPRDLTDLEVQFAQWETEGVWKTPRFSISRSQSARQNIAEISRYLQTTGRPNDSNYIGTRQAKILLSLLFALVYGEERKRMPGLKPKKLATHVMDCIEATIRLPGGQHPSSRKRSHLRESIRRFVRVGNTWWISSSVGLGLTVFVDRDCGQTMYVQKTQLAVQIFP